MTICDLKRLLSRRFSALILSLLVLFTLGIGIFSSLEMKIQEAEATLVSPVFNLDSSKMVVFQENSLASLSSPNNPESEAIWKMGVIITAYSSSTWETDEDPFITAAGTWVRDGIVANNWLSFGTKIKIPELFGDKVFVVEDRMSWEKGNYHVDIWFSDYWQALSFGAKRTYIEILEG